MDQKLQHDLAGTIGADAGRRALLEDIIGKVEGLEATASDDEIDLWWGSVEIDRLASGLTLAAIAKLARPGSEDEPAGPWIDKSDETGDEPTTLTSDGREAIRRSDAVHRATRSAAVADTADGAG